MDIEYLTREIQEELAKYGIETDYTNEILAWVSDKDLDFLDQEVDVLAFLFMVFSGTLAKQ